MPTDSSLEGRYKIEIEKFDSIADKTILDASAVVDKGAKFTEYAKNSTYLPGVAEFLGDLDGKKVLETGCGVGHMSTLLAKSGAALSTFDISPKCVEVATERARLNGVEDRIDFRVAAGENLPYENESFDIVLGKGILHHLDATLGAPEIYRVLKNGGKAAFSEPLSINKVVEFARDHLWYPAKAIEGADAPLDYEALEAWGRCFDTFEYKEIHLLGMLERLVAWRWHFHTLHRIDKVLLENIPFLRRFCNYAVIFMGKAQSR